MRTSSWRFQLARAVFSLLTGVIFSSCAPGTNKYWHAQEAVPLLKTEHGSGSGFPIQRTNPNGQPRIFLWTAAHVVHECNTIKVVKVIRFEHRKVGTAEYSATVIARDEPLDLALLWLDAPPGSFEPVSFDNHNELPVGSAVYHCGNFHGESFSGSVSTGIISQLGVRIDGAPSWIWASPLDQTTCTVHPGSSGGPMFCSDCNRVCGVVVARAGDGIGFFVPLRTMDAFAVIHSVSFAITGSGFFLRGCPSDSALSGLATTARYVPPESPDPNKPIDADP